MSDDQYDAACAELESTLSRLLSALSPNAAEGSVPLDWTLVVGWMEPDSGETFVDVISGPSTLRSHTLGALEFGRIVVSESIRRNE